MQTLEYNQIQLGLLKYLLLTLTRKLTSTVVTTIYFNYYFKLNVPFRLSMLDLWGSY